MSLILHITRRTDWEAACESGSYAPDSLKMQGFIHCATPEQVIPVADFLFKGKEGLVLLRFETDRVKSEIRYENLEGGAKLFPHVYGALEIEAVVSVHDFPPKDDGSFELPQTSDLPTLVNSWDFYEEAARRGEYGEIVSPEGKISLSKSHEEMAGFFIAHLKGKTAVLDAGCGSGFPSLALAPHVRHLIALDAAPAMCAKVNAHVRQLNYHDTMRVVRGDATALPFRGGSFDGAVISGTLGSLSQPRLFLKDLHRTMRPKGVVACVAQNFARKMEADKGKPNRWFQMDQGRLSLCTIEYLERPYRMRDCRYSIKETSELYRKLANEHPEPSWQETTQQKPYDLPPDAIAQALCDEAVQFDPQSLTALFVETGFRERHSEVRNLFGAECLCAIMDREDSKG